jgi:hemoglobin
MRRRRSQRGTRGGRQWLKIWRRRHGPTSRIAVSDNERTPTLYEWAGGDAAFARLIDCFYDRVEHDDRILPLFHGGVSREHREHVAAWWSEVFGGPARYSAELGGYSNMVDKHRDLGISSGQRRRFVELMSVAADDAELPDDPEFRSALLAYLEWGTRLAFTNSQSGSDVAAVAPVPRWGWAEAPPFEG